MIVITGAAGFISSCLVAALNERGIERLVLVDDFSREEKENNWKTKAYAHAINRDEFPVWFERNADQVQCLVHLGARTDTTEFDEALLKELNLDYSKSLWNTCVKHEIPMIYASSAATYGLGELGYEDRHDVVDNLQPLNPYGVSKNNFDRWVLKQDEVPPRWYGLKFFNVYGPNEYHKGRMASVVLHTFRQVKASGKMNLFRSHRPDYADGMQSRDFVYVKDVVKVIEWLMEHAQAEHNGIYNLGSGKARAFLDLARATFKSMNVEEKIGFIDTPEDIRDKYQYFTEAQMDKLKAAGYPYEFHSLEEGVEDYVKNYLSEGKYW